jgi:hypothetical protein
MRHPDGRGTTVPVHQGRDVAKGTLRGISFGHRPDRRGTATSALTRAGYGLTSAQGHEGADFRGSSKRPVRQARPVPSVLEAFGPV